VTTKSAPWAFGGSPSKAWSRPLGSVTTPTWRRYVEALPNGMASHPECLVKGSILRSLVDSASHAIDLGQLPKECVALLRDPPLPNAWLSEVAFNTIMLAYREGLTKSESDAWVLDRNRKLFANSLYRVLFWVVSPERLFAGTAQRYSAFRRGSNLSAIELRPKLARLALVFPRHLHNDETLHNIALAFQGAGEASGAQNTKVDVNDVTDLKAEILVHWD
jgi:hypothetical protein